MAKRKAPPKPHVTPLPPVEWATVHRQIIDDFTVNVTDSLERDIARLVSELKR